MHLGQQAVLQGLQAMKQQEQPLRAWLPGVLRLGMKAVFAH
jgi:hypothetical protein